jgi:glutamine amidotransferase
MCELLGVSTDTPIRIGLSMARLAAHGDPARHLGDGWGVALHDGADAFVVRLPEPAIQSPWVHAVETLYQPISLAIAHIRRATRGKVTLRNTQPFCRELGGRLHVFAHNGDLPGLLDHARIPGARFQPIGDTDSEMAFCGLMERLADLWSSGLPSLIARHQVIADYASTLRVLGPANFLYTDGDALFAHADRRTQADGSIAAPGLVLLNHAGNDDGTFPSHPIMNQRAAAAAGPAVTFASVPLSDEPWEALPQGALIAVQRGRILVRG